MADSPSNRLFQAFRRSGMNYRTEIEEGQVVKVVVFRSFTQAAFVTQDRPEPTDGQLDAIRGILSADKLDEQDVIHTDDVQGILLDLPAICYTKRP